MYLGISESEQDYEKDYEERKRSARSRADLFADAVLRLMMKKSGGFNNVSVANLPYLPLRCATPLLSSCTALRDLTLTSCGGDVVSAALQALGSCPLIANLNLLGAIKGIPGGSAP
jgi:hypothetical protein